MDNTFKVLIAVPFPSQRAAQIAYDVLKIDLEPKKNHVRKTFKVVDNILNVEFVSEVAKNIRVCLTNFFESLMLCTETQLAFGPASEEYSHY